MPPESAGVQEEVVSGWATWFSEKYLIVKIMEVQVKCSLKELHFERRLLYQT